MKVIDVPYESKFITQKEIQFIYKGKKVRYRFLTDMYYKNNEVPKEVIKEYIKEYKMNNA